MKILKLTAYGYPEKTAGGYLGGNLNQAFIRQGWDIVTYMPTPSRGVSDDIRKQYKTKKFRKEITDDGHHVIHRFSMYKEGQNPIMRAIRYFLCTIKHFNRGVFTKDARQCDVMFIYSTPPIQGAMAAMVKVFRGKIKFVYSLQDIFPDSMAGTGLSKKGGFLWKK